MLRILWYSVTPKCHSGYGNATRNMVTWLTKQGYYAPIATKHELIPRWDVWKVPGTEYNVPIICGTNIKLINKDIIAKWNMDFCISMFDVWIMKMPIDKHIPWIPIDTEVVSEKIIEKVKDCPMQIAMTKHGKRELESFDLAPEYAPIGFDPEVFYYREEEGQQFRESLAWKDGLKADEMFLVGCVGLNYPDDRKGIITLMQAFKVFHDQHHEARLYIHTQGRKDREGINYPRIATELGIMDYVGWADPADFWLGQYTEDHLAAMYSAMDLFCLATHGEGFGMPLIEAQACGTPVVVTDNTSGRELMQSGWMILTDKDDLNYMGLNTWRLKPKPSEVLRALNVIYNRSRYKREAVSEAIAEYRWENVWEQHWTPIIQKIEAMLPIVEEDEMMSNRGE